MSDLFSLDDLGLDSAIPLTTTNVALAESDAFSRMLYLLNAMKIELPSWLKYKLPYADSLSKPLSLWSPLLKSAYKKGSVYGEGTTDELKQCLDQVIYPELKAYTDRNNFYSYLQTLASGLFDDNEEIALKDIEAAEGIEKFKSGFSLFDIAVGGFYQAIVTIAGTPGSGKTTLLLSLLGELASSYPVWYFQTEIPGKLIKSRIAQVKPASVYPGCMIHCGNYNSDNILERVKKEPDNNRIIIYDSPEIKNTADDPIKYFEKVYQDLVAIKQLSKMVIVTSQTKQNTSWEDLGIYSLSDSAAKARYSDIIIYVGRIGDTVLVKTGKNRFGQLGQNAGKYNYETMQLEDSFIASMYEDWGIEKNAE